MAAAVEIQRMLDNGSEYIPAGTSVSKGDTSFNEVLGKEILVQNTKQSFTPLTQDKQVSEIAQKIIQGIFSGNLDETSLKEMFNGLTDNMQRVDILSIIQQIISYAKNETYGVCPSGKAQDYINRLFYAGTDAPTVTGTNTDINSKLDEIIEQLKKDDSKDSDVLSQLATLIQQMNTQQTGTVNMFKYDSKVLGLNVGNATYTMDYNELATRLMNVVSNLVDKPVAEIFPNYSDETQALSVINNVPLGTGVTQNGGGTPTLMSPGLLSQGVSTETVADSFSANTKANIQYGEVTNTNTAKLMAESEVLKASMLSQRINRKNDLSELGYLTSSNQTPVQSVSIDEVLSKLTENPVENQIMSNISESIKNSVSGTTKEMTMMLNPKELGQIAVKIVNEAGKVSVTIAAQSEVTQKLLQERLPLLVQNLQNTNSDVKVVEIATSQQSQMEYFGQSNANTNSGNQSNHSYGSSAQNDYSVSTDDVAANPEKGVNVLWQTA